MLAKLRQSFYKFDTETDMPYPCQTRRNSVRAVSKHGRPPTYTGDTRANPRNTGNIPNLAIFSHISSVLARKSQMPTYTAPYFTVFS